MGVLGRVPRKAATQRRDEGVGVRLGAGLLLAEDLEQAATPPPGPLRERAVEVPQDDPLTEAPSRLRQRARLRAARGHPPSPSRPCRIAAAVAASTSRRAGTEEPRPAAGSRSDGVLDPEGAHLGAAEGSGSARPTHLRPTGRTCPSLTRRSSITTSPVCAMTSSCLRSGDRRSGISGRRRDGPAGTRAHPRP